MWILLKRCFIARYKIILFAVITIIAGSYFIFHYSKSFDQQDSVDSNPGLSINSAVTDSNGAALYLQNCASCHGANLEGEVNWRSPKADGSLPAPPHNQDGHTWHHPDRLLFHITKFGGSSVAPKGFKSNMPAFQDVLSDNEISATLEFIKSTWPKDIRQRQKHITDKDAESSRQ
ncbi:c-type cytochrome [Kiloniella litopenaei]|uniref:c-type cytochrome n=1 Tax=Kiloniella litopenaei TaxID=1549748 RepID=UPI000698F575|nr:cytochrome c [Kiloniella litopenaei]